MGEGRWKQEGECVGGAGDAVPWDVRGPLSRNFRPRVGEVAEGGGAGVGTTGASEGEGTAAKRPERER